MLNNYFVYSRFWASFITPDLVSQTSLNTLFYYFVIDLEYFNVHIVESHHLLKKLVIKISWVNYIILRDHHLNKLCKAYVKYHDQR